MKLFFYIIRREYFIYYAGPCFQTSESQRHDLILLKRYHRTKGRELVSVTKMRHKVKGQQADSERAHDMDLIKT